ncbi:DUF3592 domain-containing protein [Pseudomarimonas salicorniae]|uniref:DUF3592 domain-containing protein n=1 Tax=Pseudomarimonas salicorniae TaxID=2933270 RepID=A0ABT0GHF6_9GAMM|nr:DUF3592 domain-containing protein [Lysobacter sp. CAU 1642]MCK7593777.1 DUF3592 domain-containing protein [Lysobacter sp. CAU 1642]
MGRVLSLILGLVCLAGSLYTGYRSLEFRQQGEVVQGTVVEESLPLGLMSGGLSYTQRIKVAYTPIGADDSFELETGFTANWFASPDPGEAFAVRYLPHEPDDARQDSLFLDIASPLGLFVLALVALAGNLGPASHGASRVLFRGSRR